MAEGQNRFVCDGCGRQFNNREALESHRAECAAVLAKQQQGRTRAMGSTSDIEDVEDVDEG